MRPEVGRSELAASSQGRFASSEAVQRRKLSLSLRMTHFPMARVSRVSRARSEATSLGTRQSPGYRSVVSGRNRPRSSRKYQGSRHAAIRTRCGLRPATSLGTRHTGRPCRFLLSIEENPAIVVLAHGVDTLCNDWMGGEQIGNSHPKTPFFCGLLYMSLRVKLIV